MKKLLSTMCTVICITAMCLVCSSCEKTNGLSSESGIAPKSIVGKTLAMSTSSRQYTFTDSSSFTFEMTGDNKSFVEEPSYTYIKTGDETATLMLKYVVHTETGKDYTTYTEDTTITLYLHFNSSASGWGTGTVRTTGLPSWLSYDPTIEYMDFTLL